MRPFCLLLTVGGILLAGPAEAAVDPWDRASFEAKPGDVLEAVEGIAAPEDADVHVLLEEETYRFEDDGRQTHTLRRVYHCVTRSGAEDWSYSEGEWSPWREKRPEIRARVITPDGNSRELNPKDLAEVPVDQDSRDVYTDRRMLRGPLPAVRAGAVVEEVVVTRETQPFFAGGVVEQMLFLALHPTRKARLVLDAPAELPLDAIRAEERSGFHGASRYTQGGLHMVARSSRTSQSRVGHRTLADARWGN